MPGSLCPLGGGSPAVRQQKLPHARRGQDQAVQACVCDPVAAGKVELLQGSQAAEAVESIVSQILGVEGGRQRGEAIR